MTAVHSPRAPSHPPARSMSHRIRATTGHHRGQRRSGIPLLDRNAPLPPRPTPRRSRRPPPTLTIPVPPRSDPFPLGRGPLPRVRCGETDGRPPPPRADRPPRTGTTGTGSRRPRLREPPPPPATVGGQDPLGPTRLPRPTPTDPDRPRRWRFAARSHTRNPELGPPRDEVGRQPSPGGRKRVGRGRQGVPVDRSGRARRKGTPCRTTLYGRQTRPGSVAASLALLRFGSLPTPSPADDAA